MTPEEALHKAADVLSENGWRQNSLGSPDDSMCALGAIRCAVTGQTMPANNVDWDDDPLVETAAAKLLASLGWPRSQAQELQDVTGWNDRPGRTAEEVILAMKRAASE